MKSDHFHQTNGVDDEFVHKNILELLIKEKIMAIKKTNGSKTYGANRTFKNIFKNNKNNQDSDLTIDEKKLNIAIVELPKSYYIQNYSFSNDEPVIINIEDPIFMQDRLDSISLYNIEITGDHLIDYNIDTNLNDDFKLKPSIDYYSSDNQSVISSYATVPAKETTKTHKVKNLIQDLDSINKQDFDVDYELEINKQHRKHSLEAITKISSQGFCFKDSTGIKVGKHKCVYYKVKPQAHQRLFQYNYFDSYISISDDPHFVKLCLSDSDIS